MKQRTRRGSSGAIVAGALALGVVAAAAAPEPRRADAPASAATPAAARTAAPAARSAPADSAATAGTAAALAAIGRTATPAELRAWDIDVRADFEGLPPGSGSVELGQRVWEEKCASCHGVFGESNEVFTPIVGGTSKRDIETGRVWFLAHPGNPHRTTLMRVSRVSTLWDYINRAMPWNAPKSLKTDEVYGVLAYILNLGEIVPADFTLSDRNIAEVQQRMPNRNGKVFYAPMWETRGKGDVTNTACMRDCPVDDRITSSIPPAAQNANGNIAEQVRPFGPARGTDTSRVAASAGGAPADGDAAPTRAGSPAAEPRAVSTAGEPRAGAPAALSGAPTALLQANACTGCHAVDAKIVGPAFRAIARKYAGRADAADYLANKIRSGGQGVWGTIPMPAQSQLKAPEAAAIAAWLADGAK